VTSRRRATLVQTAYFAPRGLAGLAYWYALYPFHALIFRHLISRIGARASELARGDTQTHSTYSR